jgi:hypothetical protein
MTTRREFIKKGSLGFVAAAASPAWVMGQTKISSNGMTYVSKRPALALRNFSSKSVDQTIARIKSKIKDESALKTSFFQIVEKCRFTGQK